MNGLSAAGLADLAGVTEAEVRRLVDLGVLVAREGAGPFLETDVQKVRLATACERAGLPMTGIAAAVKQGRLSFAFLEASPYRRWAVRSARTYRQVSQETGVPLELLGSFLEAIGFARMAPDELVREDELEVVPMLQLGLSSGFLDQVWSTRLGRGYAEGLRLIASIEKEVWQARLIAPLLASGADQQTARDRASQLSMDLNAPAVIDRALMAAYRRQQELSWIEQLVEDIEAAVEETGGLGRPEWVPAMCFLDLVGYTRLTEEHGDQVAAELAEASRVLVSERVAERTPPQGVTFVELGQVQLQGIARPVPLLEAHRA
jgi:adenylate cyclase